jgi:hypothetical protein
VDRPGGFEAAVLDFVAPTALGYLSAIRRLYGEGCRRLLFRGFDATAQQVAEALRDSGLAFEALAADGLAPGAAVPAGFGRDLAAGRADAVLLFETGADALSARLADFIDTPACLVAPVTARFYKRRPVFVVTIPKAGTHLLFQLLSEFDIRTGGPFDRIASPQHWYFPTTTSHLPFGEFTVLASGWGVGGSDHPLFASPVLFMYRNPLDILVSESRWLAKRDKSAVAHYFSTMTEEQRLLALIEDDPVLHDIRYRIRSYLPWLTLENTIPLSFESLVGPSGRGSADEQLRTVWSLQLKLHVPGRPAVFARHLFNPDSPTFEVGEINAHRAAFTAAHWQAFRRLPQDFMAVLGYDAGDRFGDGYVPRFVEQHRRRPLVCAATAAAHERREETTEDTRLLTYRGYHVGQLRRRYWAVPQHARHVTPWRDRPATPLHSSTTLAGLAALLDSEPLGNDAVWRPAEDVERSEVFVTEPEPPLLVVERGGHNIVHFAGRYYVVPHELGDFDLQYDGVEDDRVRVVDSLDAALQQLEQTAAGAAGA